MTDIEKARAYDVALKRAKEIKSKILSSHLSTESCKAVSEYIDTIIPELAESEDERIRKAMVGLIEELQRSEKNFDGVELTDMLAYLEKQKDASKAIEAVDRIDKYIDEHLANAHDMKDSNPDKKYYRGWDDALGEMAGILQDVYSEEKKKEQKDYRKLYEGIVKSEWFKKAYVGKSLGEEEEKEEQKPIIQDVELNDAVYDYVRDHFIEGADFTPEYIKKLMENAFFAGVDYYLLKQESESCEPDTNVEKVIEDVIRVYGKTQGEWVGGYDIDTLIVNLRRAFNKKEQNPNIEICPHSIKSKSYKENGYPIENCDYGLEIADNILEKTLGKVEGYQSDDGIREHQTAIKAVKDAMKEQKPAENEKVEMTDFEQSIYDLCPVLGIEEAKDTASDLLELAKKILLKTGKVVLASNYPEGCSFEDGFHLGYNEGFNAKKEQNPIKWTDLTWKDIDELERIINNVHYEFRNGIGEESFGKEVLERFRNKKDDAEVDACEQKPIDYEAELKKCKDNPLYFYDKYVSIKQKSAEWSEEDKEALDMCIDAIPKAWKTKSGILLTKWLKDNIHPQPKQEWSEEDERIAYTILNLLCSQVTYVTGQGTTYGKQFPTYAKERDWFEKRFKSLRPQPKKELSIDKAIKWLDDTFYFLDNSSGRGRDCEITTHDFDSLEEMYDSFRKAVIVDSEPHWKPSDEQMDSLRDTIVQTKGYSYSVYLPELYEQLKKLM